MLGKFTNAIVKSRPLKEIGAEQVFPLGLFTYLRSLSHQLLIDLQIVKAYLLKMPGESLLTPRYVHICATRKTSSLRCHNKLHPWFNEKYDSIRSLTQSHCHTCGES